MNRDPVGVNRRAWLGRIGGGFCALTLTAATAGCLRPTRDAPVEPNYTWTNHLGSNSRDAYGAESVVESTPDIAWNVNTGRGLDSPPVALGPVIVTATTNRMVIALSADSGEPYWEHRKNGPFQSPPLSDGDRLYLATADTRARVYALRLRDGKEQWEKTYPGLSSPMVLADGRLYLVSEPGLVTALRTRDGSRVWQASLGAPSAGAPVLVEDRLYAATVRDTLYVLSSDDGTVTRRQALPGRVSAPPAEADGVLFLPLRSGHILSMDATTLEERWRTPVGGPVLAAPVVTADGTIYALARSGQVWALAADGQPTQLADLNSAAAGALTVTANAVLIGLLDGRLVSLDRTDGSELWTLDLGDSLQTPPVVQDGCIYVPLRRGRVVKLQCA